MPCGRPTDIQLRVAAALSIDSTGDSRGVAAARIYDSVAEAIGERHGPLPATAKHVEFTQRLGLDARRDSVRVASAKIADELDRRNWEALGTLALQPGDRVMTRKVY